MPIEWDLAKPAIHNLYVIQKRSLLDVQQSLDNHGFHASIRSYRGKLKEWGFMRKKDIGERLSQVEHAIQPGMTQTSSTNHAMSDMTFQPSSFMSSSNNANTWLPAIPDYGLTQNFGPVSPSSHTFVDVSSSRQDFPILLNPVFSPQTSVSLDKLDDSGRTLLHDAVLRRSLEDVEKQLALGSNPNIPDPEGQSPLHLASEKGWQDFIRLLIKRGANAKAQNNSGQTPLHLAIKFPKAVRALLAAHPEVSCLDHNKNSPLHLAISIAALDDPPRKTAIEELIHANANMNIKNNEGKTPFELILNKSTYKCKFSYEYIALFLDNGADISIPTSTGTLPFQNLMENTHSPYSSNYKFKLGSQCLAFKMFIDRGGDSNSTLASGRSIFGEIMHRGTVLGCLDYGLIKLLCETVRVDTPDTVGEYPLHYISKYFPWRLMVMAEAIECVEILIGHGAGIDQKNKVGETPLTAFIKNDIYRPQVKEFINVLSKHGAKLMLPNDKNELPILIATTVPHEHKRKETFNALLDGISADEGVSHWWRDRPQLEEIPNFLWWTGLLHFLKAPVWTNPTDLKEGFGDIPLEDAKYILNSILSYVARKHFESSKASFEHLKETKGLDDEETQKQISDMVHILRDCDKHEIKIDESWYRYVLKFFP